MSKILEFISVAICSTLHRDIYWPVKGEYRCRVCHRTYAVIWEAPAPDVVHSTPVNSGGQQSKAAAPFPGA